MRQNPGKVSELEQTLAALRAQGTLDSSGALSIDLRKMADKMGIYQLLNKSHFSLMLMAAAFRRRAAEVVILDDEVDFILSWPGSPLERRELEALFRLEGPMLPLGLALLSAQTFKPRYIRVDSGPHRFELRGDRLRILEIPAFPGVKVQIRRRSSWRAFAKSALRRLRSVAPRLPPESALIVRHCGELGWPIQINSQPLSTQLQLGPVWLVLKLRGRAGRSQLDALVPGQDCPTREREIEGDYSAVILFGAAFPGPRLTVVAQGLRFAQPRRRSPDPFMTTLVLRPEQRVDISYSRVHEDQVLTEILAAVEQAADDALMEDLTAAPPQLLGAIGTRLYRRGHRSKWLQAQASLIASSQPPQRRLLLSQMTNMMPPQAPEPEWQDALATVLRGIAGRRRSEVCSHTELGDMIRELRLLSDLRPEPELRRAIRLEESFLTIALGGLSLAAQALIAAQDPRVGLVVLVHQREPDWLPPTPLAAALQALLQGPLAVARENLERAPSSPLILDLRSRVEALSESWDRAEKFNQQAIEQTDPREELSLRLRHTYAQALRGRRLDHPLPPPGDLAQQLQADLSNRGLALYSSSDIEKMAGLQDGSLAEPGMCPGRTAVAWMGAAQPYTRAVAWTLGNRHLASGRHSEGFELILLAELTALWKFPWWSP